MKYSSGVEYKYNKVPCFYSGHLWGQLVGPPGKTWNKLVPSLQDYVFRASYKPTSGENM